MNYVIVETEKGHEVWPDLAGSQLTGIFPQRSDAELFIAFATRSDADRIHNAALNIARAFPDLNYSNAPINPDGEPVLKIAGIIREDFPVANQQSAGERCVESNETDGHG